MKEPLMSNVDELIEDLYGQMKAFAGKNDYAIYGHSMGGLLAYLLALKLIENNVQAPLHLFITGTTGPSALSRKEKIRHLMAKDEFIQEIRDLKGMPDEILDSDEMLEYFEPILRADFRISENYLHKEPDPLDMPFTVITGTEEDMEIDDIQLWQRESKHPVDFKRLPGNHFFIFQHSGKIIEIIARKLYPHTGTQRR